MVLESSPTKDVRRSRLRPFLVSYDNKSEKADILFNVSSDSLVRTR